MSAHADEIGRGRGGPGPGELLWFAAGLGAVFGVSLTLLAGCPS